MAATFRATLLATVFLLGFARLAVGLTILDIVQLSQRGYDSAQIIALIDATNSVFQLEAEDLPRLKQLGVSEAVIRVMLKRVAPRDQTSGQPASGAASDPKPVDPRPITPNREPSLGVLAQRLNSHRAQVPDATAAASNGGPVESVIRTSVSADRVAAPLAAFHPVPENLTGGHAHVAVALGGWDIFILREEGAYASVNARAEEVAHRLEALRDTSDGDFQHAMIGGEQAVVFRSARDVRQVAILSVTPRDARTYAIRSGRPVNAALLARYWADLLSDYWRVIVKRSAPERLTTTHSGEALMALYDAVRNNGATNGRDGPSEILPESVRHHLQELAGAVPKDYPNGG